MAWVGNMTTTASVVRDLAVNMGVAVAYRGKGDATIKTFADSDLSTALWGLR
jgi:hypothetical protein